MCERGESTALSSWCAQAGVNINASESGVRIITQALVRRLFVLQPNWKPLASKVSCKVSFFQNSLSFFSKNLEFFLKYLSFFQCVA